MTAQNAPDPSSTMVEFGDVQLQQAVDIIVAMAAVEGPAANRRDYGMRSSNRLTEVDSVER